MKVVQFIPYFPPHTGGLENIAQNISTNLIKYTDTEVLIITSDIGQKYKGYYEYVENGYKVICVPSFNIVNHFPCFKFWTKGYRKAMIELKNFNPDVIHTHTRFFLQTFHGGIRAKRHHKKWIHTEHGSGFVKGIGKIKETVARIYDQIFGRFVFSKADKIVSINKINLEFIKKFTNLSKCEVIYNGIEDYNIKQKGNESGLIRMCYIGRLSPLKGVDILLRVIKFLQKKGINNFKLDIIGDGEEFENLQKYVDDNKLKNVKLLGKKNHSEIIENILPNTDILINPSHQEGLPTTVLEGLIGKCVVVATDVGGTSEISNKGDLILVKSGDEKKLATGMEFAIENYKKLSGLSYEHLKDKFSWENNVKGYIKIYKSLLKIK